MAFVADGRCLVAEDERDCLRAFAFDSQQGSLRATGQTLDFGARESDFESLAFDENDGWYYCVGSHGEKYSRRLIRFRIDGNTHSEPQTIHWRADALVRGHIDIEALTVCEGGVLLGFRSPMRKQHALAVWLNPESGVQLLGRFDLGGRSFRDLCRIDDANYLILAGPQQGKHYSRLPSRVIWWNGSLKAPHLHVCPLDLQGVRAEGIAARRNTQGMLDVLIGTDESKVAGARQFRAFHIACKDVDELRTRSRVPRELAVML